MEPCPKCKELTLRLVGFDKEFIYKRCVRCSHSVKEPKAIQRRPAFIAGDPTSFGMEKKNVPV